MVDSSFPGLVIVIMSPLEGRMRQDEDRDWDGMVVNIDWIPGLVNVNKKLLKMAQSKL